MPFDIAFSLDETERLAFIVALGTLAGREFDWAAIAWKENS